MAFSHGLLAVRSKYFPLYGFDRISPPGVTVYPATVQQITSDLPPIEETAMAHTATHAPRKGAKHAAQTQKTPAHKNRTAPIQDYLPGNSLDREGMIAEAAYYLAERRGFEGGDPVADWLEAEAEIDAIIDGIDDGSVH